MKKIFIKNNSGFISIFFLSLIFLLSTTLFSYSFIFYIQKQKGLFKKYCYIDLVDIQKMNIQNEKSLFKLNSLSSYYRSNLLFLKAQLAAAIIAQNYPLIAQLNIEMHKTLNRQKSLDLMQKNMILIANSNLKIRLKQLEYQINNDKNIESAIWGNLIQSNNRFKLKLNSILAVQPDSIGGIGPNYELRIDYKRTQNLSLEMQVNIKNKFEMATFLESQQSLKEFCDITLNREGTNWILETNLGKY